MSIEQALKNELEFVESAAAGEQDPNRAKEIRAELAALKGDVEKAVSPGPKAKKSEKD
jgi:hypothetical protein